MGWIGKQQIKHLLNTLQTLVRWLTRSSWKTTWPESPEVIILVVCFLKTIDRIWFCDLFWSDRHWNCYFKRTLLGWKESTLPSSHKIWKLRLTPNQLVTLNQKVNPTKSLWVVYMLTCQKLNSTTTFQSTEKSKKRILCTIVKREDQEVHLQTKTSSFSKPTQGSVLLLSQLPKLQTTC